MQIKEQHKKQNKSTPLKQRGSCVYRLKVLSTKSTIRYVDNLFSEEVGAIARTERQTQRKEERKKG